MIDCRGILNFTTMFFKMNEVRYYCRAVMYTEIGSLEVIYDFYPLY